MSMGKYATAIMIAAVSTLTACANSEVYASDPKEEFSREVVSAAISISTVDLNIELITLSTVERNYRVQLNTDSRVTIYYDNSMYVTDNAGYELLYTPEYIIYKEAGKCGIYYTTEESEYYFDLSERIPVPLEEFTLKEDGSYVYVDDRSDGMFWYRLDDGSITMSDVLPAGIADDDIIEQITTYTLELSDDKFVIDVDGWLTSGHLVVTPAYGIPSVADPSECKVLTDFEIIHILNGRSLQ